MRFRRYAAGALLVAATLLAGCGSGGGDGKPAAGAASGAGAVNAGAMAVGLKVGTSPWGPILTDQAGRTLYGFVPDHDGTSSCTASCAATWPPLTSRSAATVGSGLSVQLLGKTQRTEGTSQITYGPWPLYYFAGDTRPGDMDGQGVDGIWFVVGPDGKLIKNVG
jgi:predicted lipoprotein with Yx(FWY)xxD motif